MWQLRAAFIGCVWMVGCGTDPASPGQAGASGSAAAGSGAPGSGAAAPAGASASSTKGGSSGSAPRAGQSGQGGASAGGSAGSQDAEADAGEPPSDLPALDPPIMPGEPGPADVQLEVSSSQLHAISPLVYGTNGAPDGMRTRPTVARSGGNRMTAYNWENNASNAGSDYMFQNDGFLSPSDEPAKPILDGIAQAVQLGAASIVTVPCVDLVSADKKGDGDVRKSQNFETTRFKQNKAAKGSAFAATPDPNDDSVYEDEFVAFLKAHAPSGSRILFSLDNEPDLWASTHAEVHPMAVTYAELWERNQRFSTAIKAAWPEAAVLGFVSYGWNGYVTLQNAPDAMGRDFIEFYLDQAKAAEGSAGKRLIDYLDVHWYPEAKGGGVRVTEQNNDAAVVAAREQAPRSLWDKDYSEESWIHDVLKTPIYLVPRLRDKISSHYPDTQLAITEWNYGGGNHISGAIAVADVLGVFGREGVALATYWALHDDETFAYAAFRAFRNYDGSGATFGDVGLNAATSDVQNVTVYASLHATAPEQVVIVAINKALTDKSVALRVAHPHKFGALTPYRIAGGSAELTKQSEQASAADNAWKLTLPAQSVSVLVPQP